MRSKWWLSILLLFCAAPAWAVNVERLDINRTQALFVQDDSLPLLHVSLAFRQTGWAHDAADRQGRASVLASILTEGAGTKNAQQFHAALEEQAIGLTVRAGRDITSIQLDTLTENRREAFALLRDALARPHLDDAELSRIKDRQLAQLRRLQESPEYNAGRALAALAYGAHPYAQSSLGTPETVSSITSAELKQWLADAFAQDRVVISVVGAISKNELEDELESLLDSLPKKAAYQPAIDSVTLDDKGQWRDVEMDIPQSMVLVASQGLPRNDPDYYAAYVMNHILGGGSLTSRLSDAIREQRGLAYYVGTQLDQGDYANVWQGMFATRGTQVKESLTAFEETLDRFASEGATQAERDAAVGYITGSFPLQIDKMSDIAAYLMAMQLYDLGLDYFDKRNDYFRSVTLEQVNQVAARLIDSKKLKIIKLGGAAGEKDE